jgi:hypothetical protein
MKGFFLIDIPAGTGGTGYFKKLSYQSGLGIKFKTNFFQYIYLVLRLENNLDTRLILPQVGYCLSS